MAKQAGVYLIRNIINGRRYVGSAMDVKRRWRAHRSLLLKGSHHSPALQRSWLKHGESAFSFEILEKIIDVTALIQREQFWIDELTTTCPRTGFNVSPTAGSPLGTKRSSEARAKMSAQRKGRKLGPCSPEHKEALSRARKAHENATGSMAKRNQSAAMRAKVRAAKLARCATKEGRAEAKAMADKRWAAKRASGEPLGRPHSEATKAKMSLAKKGRMTPEHKASIAASNKRRAAGWHEFGPPIHA